MPPPMPPDDHESASLMNEDTGSMPPDPNAPPAGGDDALGAAPFSSILITPAEAGGFAVTVTKPGAKPGDAQTSENAMVASMDDIVKYVMSDLSGGGATPPAGGPGGGMPPQP